MYRFKIKCSAEILYEFFICILVFLYMMEATSWELFSDCIIHDVLLLIAIAVAAVYIIVRKYTADELFHIGLLNTIGVLCFLSSGFTGLFMTMLSITLLPRNSLDRILHIIFVEEIIIFVGIILCSQIGFLANTVTEVHKGTYIVEVNTFGFVHPNMFAAQATSIVFLFLCINRNSLKIRHLLGSFSLILIIFLFSQGRTSLLLGIMTIMLIMLHKKKWVSKTILSVLPWMYVIILGILISCMAMYSKDAEAPIVKFLNDGLFNGRIGLAYRSLLVYPITLLGKPLDRSVWDQWQYYSLDNGQVMVLLEYGIIGFMGYWGVIQRTLNHLKKEKETVFAIIMIAFLIWSMYEGTMYFIGKNFTFLFLGTLESIDSSDLRKNAIKSIRI